MLIIVKTCKRRTEQMLTTYKDYDKKSPRHTVLPTTYTFTLHFTLIFWTIKTKYIWNQKFQFRKLMGEYVIWHNSLLKHKVNKIHISIKATIIPNTRTLKCTGNIQLWQCLVKHNWMTQTETLNSAFFKNQTTNMEE